MLKALKVKNFALIDDLEITFEGGLTALTGETGAGKSIILESLHLLFGKRSDQQMIRHGMPKAEVVGFFELNTRQQALLDLPKTIEVERTIDLNGRHMMRINDQATTLAKLKDVMNTIGSIHNQNETMHLYDRAFYLVFVDQVDQKRVDGLLNPYLMDRSHYLETKKHLEDLKQKKNKSAEKKSFLEYQLQELKAFNLQENEKELLVEKIEKLKHFDKMMAQLRFAYSNLENERFRIDEVYDAGKALEKIANLDPEFSEMSQRLQSAYYEIDDVKSKIYREIEQLDFDEDAFNSMQVRIYELEKIEQKYQKDIRSLIAHIKEIEEELMLITNYDGYLQEVKSDVEKAFNKAFERGIKLHELRQAFATQLSKDIIDELKDLDLEKAKFEIVFDEIKKEEASLFESGLDQVEFYISLNEGEPLKPLAKVASGGERARFMFALKSLYAKQNYLSLLILDEIDIGISGRTAAKVANKMTLLAKNMQLLVITHLPQVAAKADHHYGIDKLKEKERMVTRIQKLTDDERIEKIALMLSDEKLSHFAIEQAKMLLKK